MIPLPTFLHSIHWKGFQISIFAFFTFTDSALAFTKVLKKLEDFTLPVGDAMLEKWIGAVKAVNKHLNKGDIKSAGQVFHGAIQILRGILPAIPDKIVYTAIDDLGNKLEQELDRRIGAGSVTLADADKFIQHAANAMISAMSKTKPTAETLN